MGAERAQQPLFADEIADPDALIQAAPIVRMGRDEMNLAEFPFAVLAKTSPTDTNTLEFVDVIRDASGRTITRHWTVTASEKYGLPTATDEEVYIALMEVTKEHGFRSRTVPITRYDLIRRMGWKPDGRSYKRLELSLDRLKGVTIKAENAFWDNEAKRYITIAFGIIDNYVLVDQRRERRGIEEIQSSITWNQVIFNSFRAGNIKLLDTELYFSLRSPIAKRLYRYLDKKRYSAGRVFQIGLAKLAFEHLGLSRSYYPSQLRRKLDPAHRELIARGFLERVEYGTMIDGQLKVIYHFADETKRQRAALPPEGAAAMEALIDRGVTLKTALELIQVYPIEQIWAQIEYLPYRSARDPAAVLVQSIREGWAPPAAYLERTRREAVARAAQENQRQLESQRARIKQAAEAIFDTLPIGERRAIEREIEETLRENFKVLANWPNHPVYRAVWKEELVKAIRKRYPDRLPDPTGRA